MNDKTGEIRPMTHEEAQLINSIIDPRKEGKWFDVSAMSENERLRLQGMSRKDRRAYFRKHGLRPNGEQR